jgi:hypothetical protein
MLKNALQKHVGEKRINLNCFGVEDYRPRGITCCLISSHKATLHIRSILQLLTHEQGSRYVELTGD